MKAFLQIILTLIFAGMVAAVGDWVVMVRGTPTEKVEAKFLPDAESNTENRRQAIRTEIAQLGDHDWAGEYHSGDRFREDTTVIIAPGNGFVFESMYRYGLSDRNYGTALETNGRIRLSFTFHNQRGEHQGIASEFIPVPWGDRHYLIPADDLIGFCNKINQGTEPRQGLGLGSGSPYLLKSGYGREGVTGFPKVPPEYEPYLLTNVVEANIIGVGPTTIRAGTGEWEEKDTLVTIDAGKQQGLHPDMEMVERGLNIRELLRLTKVEESRSEGIITQSGTGERGPTLSGHVSSHRFKRRGE